MDTLEKLMSEMNMMYFYEKLRLKLPDQINKVTLAHLEKLMSRCLKLHQMIDSFMNIFKLIIMKEVSCT